MIDHRISLQLPHFQCCSKTKSNYKPSKPIKPPKLAHMRWASSLVMQVLLLVVDWNEGCKLEWTRIVRWVQKNGPGGLKRFFSSNMIYINAEI